MSADRFDDLPLDPEGAARALLLSLMARLLSPRGLAALADESGGLRVVASRGLELEEGELLADGGPGTLRPHGIALALPLRHAGETVGLVALGDKATGEAFETSEVAVARSLASAAAASVRAARAAAQLKSANRELASRAQTLGTLVELAQAFGSALDRDAVVRRLGFALMGQLLVARAAVLLREADGTVTVAGHWGVELDLASVPPEVFEWDTPAPYTEDGWAWAVPLRAGEVSRGVILLGPRATGADLDPTAAAFAASLAALAVGALETADRVSERVEKERLEGEVRLARRVQEALLPTGLPDVPGLDLAARWRPTQGVSGDAYDVAALPGGRLLVAVADVVGKGIPAALLMASLQAAVHTLRDDVADGSGLAQATARINRLLCEGTEIDQFVTFAWALVDPEAGVVRSVTAGHPAPRLVHPDGRIERLDVGGPLFGVLPGAEYTQVDTPFHPSDVLVLFSDGVSEAHRGDEEFGDTALDATLARLARQPAESVVDRLGAAVLDFAPRGVDDDLTLVAVRRTP
ncbi:MAG: PP2C family protein-serine/threonine phosphatase [Bacteroidota bacterium]